jgi:hypothetical protein
MTHNSRKVTATWPNGSSLTGYVHDTGDGGQNIHFGPGGRWAIQFTLPDGHELPEDAIDGFAEASMEWEEPIGFGAVIRAKSHLITDENHDEVWNTYVRISEPHNPGVWQDVGGVTFMWDDFDPTTVEVIAQGVPF